MIDYDQDGNLTSDGRFNYAWDGENRLVVMQAVTPAVGDKQYEFMYDYMGRRAIAFVSHYDGSDYVYDASEWYLYDGWNVVMVVNMNDTAVLRKYTWGLDLSGSIHGAGGIGGLLAAVDTQGTPLTAEDDKSYWYLYDGNGNVGQLLRYKTSPAETVTLAAHYEYSPYGSSVLRDANGVILAGIDADPVNDPGAAAANPFRFSTKWLIDQPEPTPVANTIQPSYDLYYFGYRYYSPWWGRWTNRDPIMEHGGINLYGFVFGNPFIWTDPLGLARLPYEHPECQALRKKIASLTREMLDRMCKIQTNPLGLPQRPPYPGAPPRDSVDGHRQHLVEQVLKPLAKATASYLAMCKPKCDDDDPPDLDIVPDSMTCDTRLPVPVEVPQEKPVIEPISRPAPFYEPPIPSPWIHPPSPIPEYPPGLFVCPLVSPCAAPMTLLELIAGLLQTRIS